MRFFWGLLWVVIGILLMKYTYVLTNTFGRFDWAEKYFSGGFGGTYFFYRLAGVIVVIMGALYMFGILDNLLGPISSVFGGLKE